MTHFTTSLIKSVMRIAGSIAAVASCFAFSVLTGAVTLAVTYGIAELFGILEEVFDKRKEK